jgi:hypothetical protein
VRQDLELKFACHVRLGDIQKIPNGEKLFGQELWTIARMTHLSTFNASGTKLSLVTIEIKIARQYIGESRFIIDKGFDMDSGYSSIGQ